MGTNEFFCNYRWKKNGKLKMDFSPFSFDEAKEKRDYYISNGAHEAIIKKTCINEYGNYSNNSRRSKR